MRVLQRIIIATIITSTLFGNLQNSLAAAELQAGAAKVDITNMDAGPVEIPLYARALALKSEGTTVVVITLDVVSFGMIGSIKNDFIPYVRERAFKELGIEPRNLIFNASHCHGSPARNSRDLTFDAIKQAVANFEAVKVGVGTGFEDRIQENRRMILKSGKTIDVRHAYSLPPDEEVADVGPIDPEIGVVRLDNLNGDTVAVLYHFSMHPIMGSPTGANTADITGYSSQVIEENLHDDTVALFLQGCGGDINPISYKDMHHPREAEPLGNRLGLSTLRAVRKIKTTDDSRLAIFNHDLDLPRSNLAERIIQQEEQQQSLMASIGGTTLNLKTFMQLSNKHGLAEAFPTYHASRYMHEEKRGRAILSSMDARNRSHVKAYLRNIHTMEELSRVSTNLRLLHMHQQQYLDAERRPIRVEVVGLRVGDFVLITHPGELTIPIGLKIKEDSPFEQTYVSGYTNGYIYYAPTAKQLENRGGAQEDSDCILDPAWEAIFYEKVNELLDLLK